MIEINTKADEKGPKIIVIGIGGGGNNAINRMKGAGFRNIRFVAVNTDIQVLDDSEADVKIQIGKKATSGYGAGANPEIGEAAALENEEEFKLLTEEADMCIITCGMGGGTGTGAAPVIAEYFKKAGVLTVAIVTTPFSFENTPRIKAAQVGVDKLKEIVDTIVVIPNDKLLSLSEKTLFLEDAFVIADSVLKYTVEGIAGIIYNRGMVNLDFNDLKTTLINKGTGHLGIGIVDGDSSVMEAVKQAISSPLLETTIAGADNILINTSGRINVLQLNEAINYVREMAGEKVNIIWGTVNQDNYGEEKIVVTLIATGMSDKKACVETPSVKAYEPVVPVKEDAGIIMPPFLIEARNRRRR